MIKQVNETLNSLKDGSHNINESLQYLAEQVESITNSSDIEVLLQVINLNNSLAIIQVKLIELYRI